MKKFISLLMAFVMVLSLVACGQPAADTSKTEEALSGETTGDTHIVVDHAGYEVEVPNQIERIAVCNILPLPSVLAVFFDSAEKIVGMTEGSLTAAQNSLLGELYPELLEAETGSGCLCWIPRERRR